MKTIVGFCLFLATPFVWAGILDHEFRCAEALASYVGGQHFGDDVDYDNSRFTVRVGNLERVTWNDTSFQRCERRTVERNWSCSRSFNANDPLHYTAVRLAIRILTPLAARKLSRSNNCTDEFQRVKTAFRHCQTAVTAHATSCDINNPSFGWAAVNSSVVLNGLFAFCGNDPRNSVAHQLEMWDPCTPTAGGLRRPSVNQQ